jgi:hypothetical protein
MSAENEPKTRKRIITVRHATPSRRKIVVIVAQSQDMLGNWLTPIITFEGPVNLMLESGRYARDVGIALIVSAYFYDEMMLHVMGSEADKNMLTDLSIEDDG